MLGPDDTPCFMEHIARSMSSFLIHVVQPVETFSLINRIYPKNFQVHMSCTVVLHVNIKAQLFHSIEWSSVALCVFRTF